MPKYGNNIFQSIYSKGKWKKHLMVSQIMQKNEINIQVLHQFHLKTHWKAYIYVIKCCTYTKKWKQ